MKTTQIIGHYQVPEDTDREPYEGNYYPERCLTISPLAVANMVDCRHIEENFADVLCRFPVEN